MPAESPHADVAVIDRKPSFFAGHRFGPASGGRSDVSVRVDWLVVGALTVVALVLRVLFLGDSLLDDELYMYRIVHHTSVGTMLNLIRHTEKTPPLFFLAPWVTVKLGDPTEWMRVPSLISGTACVPLGYVLGTRTVGRKAGVVGAAFLTLAPFGIYYGHNARAYAGLAFFSALSTLCLLTAVETNRRRWWVMYGVAAAAVLYTHYTGVFVLVIQAVWACWAHRERLRALLVVNALVLVAYTPWIPSFLLQQKHSLDEAERIALLVPRPGRASRSSTGGRCSVIRASDCPRSPGRSLSWWRSRSSSLRSVGPRCAHGAARRPAGGGCTRRSRSLPSSPWLLPSESASTACSRTRASSCRATSARRGSRPS